MVQNIAAHHTVPEEYHAKLFGGGNMFPDGENGVGCAQRGEAKYPSLFLSSRNATAWTSAQRTSAVSVPATLYSISLQGTYG